MASNQAYLFLIFTLNGALIGFLFDIFRVLRKTFKTSDFITYVEDIIFWILAGITILFTMYKFSDGELRAYTIIGIAIGFIIYIMTISSYIINISVYIIKILKKIISTIINIVSYPFSLIKEFSNNINKFYKSINNTKNNKKSKKN